MASIEQLIQAINADVELTDEQLLAQYAGCFDFEKKLIDEGLLKVVKDPVEEEEEEEGNVFVPSTKVKKPRATKVDKLAKMKADLLELDKLMKALNEPTPPAT